MQTLATKQKRLSNSKVIFLPKVWWHGWFLSLQMLYLEISKPFIQPKLANTEVKNNTKNMDGIYKEAFLKWFYAEVLLSCGTRTPLKKSQINK